MTSYNTFSTEWVCILHFSTECYKIFCSWHFLWSIYENKYLSKRLFQFAIQHHAVVNLSSVSTTKQTNLGVKKYMQFSCQNLLLQHNTKSTYYVSIDGHSGCCLVTANGGTEETWEENKANMNFCIRWSEHHI